MDARPPHTPHIAKLAQPGKWTGCAQMAWRQFCTDSLRWLSMRCSWNFACRIIALASIAFATSKLHGDDEAVLWPAGPLFQEFSLTLSSGTRLEALGPLWSYQERGKETQWGVHPVISYQIDHGTDSQEIDFLYPLASYDRFGVEYRFHFFQILAFSGGENIGGGTRDRFQIFPFYFQQRSVEDPSRNYTAFLPFYGSMRQKLFRDRIEFVLFPLYVETQKKDVVTKNYLLPFFHLRHGDQLHGWQFWPLGGYEEKATFSKTNNFDQVEISPGHSKIFALWPIYTSDRTGIGTTNEGTFRAVLPFGAWQRSPLRDSSTYLWPFFSFVDDREKGYAEWAAPWPFVVTSKGKGKTGFRVWPLYGEAHNDSLATRTVLWPLWRSEKTKAPAVERERNRVLLFLYSDIREKNVQANKTRRRADFWPFYTWTHDFDGSERLQVLSIVEPFTPNNKSIERNYSPLWSIWRSEHNAKTDASSLSIFWNLYRQDIKPGSTKRSFLFGLFQSESGEGGRRGRLFFIPFGKKRTEERSKTAPTSP